MITPLYLEINGLYGQQSDPIRVPFLPFELRDPKKERKCNRANVTIVKIYYIEVYLMGMITIIDCKCDDC